MKNVIYSIYLIMLVVLGTPPKAAGEPLDVIFILDVTGSVSSLIPNWKSRLPSFLSTINVTNPGSRFALVSHRDFPFNPYGESTDQAFTLHSGLNSNTGPLLTALNSLAAIGGADDPESQYEAIYQSLTGLGRDLDSNGHFNDPGDIQPTYMGLSGNPIIIYHYTYPVQFHDRDAEGNYPYPGSVRVAGRDVTLSQVKSMPVRFFGIVSGPTKSGGINPQTGMPYQESNVAAVDPLLELANETGGRVYNVGTDPDALEQALNNSLIVINGPVVGMPTLSEWAMIVFSVLLLALMTYFVVRRRNAAYVEGT